MKPSRARCDQELIDVAAEIMRVVCDPPREFLIAIVPGDPVPKERPRVVNGYSYTPQRTVDAEEEVASHLRELGLFSGNVAVICVFVRSTRRRVDVDNLLKTVLDAGNRAKIWDDDSQVTSLQGIIEYDPEHPRTIVCIGSYESTMARGDAAKVAAKKVRKRKKETA